MQEPARAGESFTWTGEGKDECQQNYPDKSAPDDSAQLAPTGSIPAHIILGENFTLASLNVEAGSWLTGGKVTVTRSLGWTGGSLGARLEMAAWSVGNIDGPDTKQFNGLLNNRGSVSLAPEARLGLVGGTNVNNFGTFTAQHGARISGSPGCVDPAVINNSGTFMVTSGLIPLPGTDTVTVSGTSFNAGGMIVNVSSGVLELHSPPGKIAASTRFTGDGTVKIIDNADTTMLGSFSVAPPTDIELGSCEGQCGGRSLLGTGCMTGDGNLLWTGGDVRGNLTLGPQIETRISGPASTSRTVRSRTWAE